MELINFKANSYNGQYEGTESGFLVKGNVSADSQKHITNISGSAIESNQPVVNFSAYGNGQGLSYNFNDIRDFTKFAQAIPAIQAAVAAVQEEISALE